MKRRSSFISFSSLSVKTSSDTSESALGSSLSVFEKYLLESPSSKEAMLKSLDDENVSQKFYEYANQKQIQENEKFIQHVKYYKKNYYDKSDMWKYNVSQRILRTFIENNTLMQINISEVLRNKIINECAGKVKETVFDDAYNEVVNMIINCHWKDFVNE